MALFAVKSIIFPEGLCPMLLVFGALPRPARRNPSVTQLKRARTMELAIISVEKDQARRRISFGLQNTGGPKEIETASQLREFPAGSSMLVYLMKEK